jgi:hypothetical protein
VSWVSSLNIGCEYLVGCYILGLTGTQGFPLRVLCPRLHAATARARARVNTDPT